MDQKKEIINLYKKKEIAKSFDEERDMYDYQKYKHFFESQILLRAINRDKLKVLDVACGTGRMLPIALKKDTNYTGLDTSKSMVKFLAGKASKMGKKDKVKVVISDATKMPFKNNTFDVVYSYHLLWHLPQKVQEKIIKEMFRVAKPGGLVIFDVLNKNFIWEKLKKFFGIKPLEGIHKMSRLDVEKIIENRSYKLKKISDMHINNNFIYGLFNVINLVERTMPQSLYHMFYFIIRK